MCNWNIGSHIKDNFKKKISGRKTQFFVFYYTKKENQRVNLGILRLVCRKGRADWTERRSRPGRLRAALPELDGPQARRRRRQTQSIRAAEQLDLLSCLRNFH